jgi:CRP-like cAMP-binding protein
MNTSQRLDGRTVVASPPAPPSGAAMVQQAAEHIVSSGFHVRHVYAKGVQLFAQGAPLHEVYWLDQGLVKLVHLDEEGRERILDLRLAQGLLGAAPVLLRLPSPVSAVTVTACQVRHMSATEFINSVESDGRISLEMLHIQSQEVYGQFQRMADLSTSSSRLRLERFLRGLLTAAPITNGNAIEVPLKRCELAQLLAVTPEHLSRLFRQLRDARVIAYEKGRLIVRDLDRLAGPNGNASPARPERRRARRVGRKHADARAGVTARPRHVVDAAPVSIARDTITGAE